MIGLFCTHHSICPNIGFGYGSSVWKWCVFNLITFDYKIGLHFFEKGFQFPEYLIQSWSIENVQNFHWLSHKNMPISRTEGYLENP